jgi:hypothetical protein
VEGATGVLVNPVPSILNSTVNPETAVTVGIVRLELHRFAGVEMEGCAGYTKKLLVSSHMVP